jgi:hypothetical protein
MILYDLTWAGIAGFLAAIVMTVVEVPFWRKWGMQGVAEWQVNWVMVSRLSKKWKTLSKPILSWTIASHLSHGVVTGIAFRILLPIMFLIPLAKWSIVLDGAVYGVVLWFLFLLLGRRTYESAGHITITRKGLLGALFSDTVFGFFLGLLVSL